MKNLPSAVVRVAVVGVIALGVYWAPELKAVFVHVKDPADAPTDEVVRADVQKPEEFEMTVFAKAPEANYPVFVAAAPDGTLYVSSDGNGSVDRAAHRGRILRLRDNDGDGRADEIKEFVKDVDSPRGLVVDHDRVYLIHPPDLSVYIDSDGDGIADKSEVLVKNCGFTFKDRPADHTTNGLALGVDGWLYVSQGDFGFVEAEGKDGRKLQFRGGGVWRVRPDGTGMEMFAYGTRNIVEAGVSPLLDIFARDNTNDGDGWDVRYHQFTGLEDHGYPRLYANFADEAVAPLADYGGGGPCGSCFIDEPGLPAGFSNQHYSVDWGRGEIFRHPAKGGSSEVGQESFLKMTRPTDLDVDANSHLYVASWMGSQFKWVGPGVGYIIRLSPRGYTAAPLPDFAKASDRALVELLLSPSAVRRLAAQRALLRRGLKPQADLVALAGDPGKPLASRIIALFTLQQGGGATPSLVALAKEPGIRAWAIRALAECVKVPAEPILEGLKDADVRVRRESVIALQRLGMKDHASALQPLLGDADPVISHTAYRALVLLNAHEAAFAVVDKASSDGRANALRALMRMHDPVVVEGLITRLGKESDFERRKGLITALCRLAQKEGVWKGESWGTRPDRRGPYYQPEPWDQTARVESALKEILANSKTQETSYLLNEFSRARINPGDASSKMIELALKDDSLLPSAVSQLAKSGSPPPPNAVALLIKATTGKNDKARAEAITALSKSDSADGFAAMLAAIPLVDEAKGLGAEVDEATEGFLNAPKLDQHVELFQKAAEKLDGKSSVWAEAVLLKLAMQKIGSPEPRDVAQRALAEAWANPQRRLQILTAATTHRIHYDDAKFVAALSDKDPAVVKAAAEAVKSLRINPEKVKAAASAKKIATMKVEEVIEAVMKIAGDGSRGEQLFSQFGCVACHTTRKTEPQKGPFLGDIANIYRRSELAEHILLPNKSIAMGFATQTLTLQDGSIQQGFVVVEAADALTIRNIAAQEIKIPTSKIAKREKSEISLMPGGLMGGGTVEDFASLLSWLEQITKETGK